LDDLETLPETTSSAASASNFFDHSCSCWLAVVHLCLWFLRL